MTSDATGPSPDRPIVNPWREEFVLALRVRDVSGPRIGDALAEVDTHCAETGQHPEASFGDPESYAAELAASLPAGAGSTPAARVLVVASSLAVLLGVALLLTGLGGVVEGHDASYSYGALGGLLAVAGICFLVVTNLSRLVREGHRIWLYSLMAAGFVLPVAAGLVWRQTAMTVPAWSCVAVGLVLLCAGFGVLCRGGADAVMDPRTGAKASL